MPLSIIDYKGKKILYIDLRGQTDKQSLAMLDEVVATAQSVGGKVSALVDITNASLSPALMHRVRELAPTFKRIFEKETIVGVDAVRGVLLRGYNAVTGGTQKPFSTIEQAKEYIAS